MANKIQLKRGLKANLPVLSVGEPAFTTDTKEVFIGNGTGNTQVATTDYVNNSVTTGNSATASKLETPRSITATGDATSTAVMFDGSANVIMSLTLANSGVTAGTYFKTTVDAKGRVTGGSNPTTLSGFGIIDGVNVSDVVTTATANKILKLDSTAKLPASITGNADGNAGSATRLQTGRTIATSGDAVGTATTFDGSANITIPLTLANSGVSAGTYNKVTVDSKGRVISATNIAMSDVTAGLGYTPLNKAGDTMTGFLLLNADPTSNMHAATKQYVDNVISGLDVKRSVVAATTTNIAVSSSTTTTLTLSATLTILDGITLTLGDRLLVKNQTVGSQNGLYVLTSTTLLTRTIGTDSNTELTPGAFTFVERGTVNADTGWLMSTDGTITLGTTSIDWTQFSSAGVIDVDNTLSKNGNIIGQKPGIVTVGTYKSVTVDTYGRVTSGTNPTTLSGYGITDAAPIASPIFTGIPKAPTAALDTNTTQLATTAFVANAIAIIDGGSF